MFSHASSASLSERLLASSELTDDDRVALLRTVQRLERDGTGAPLAGRHVAIAAAATLADWHDDVFERAARGLGARVSRIAPDLPCADGCCSATARLLPRLYDAVDCRAVSADGALALHRQAGVPVFLALGGPAHPIRALLAELPVADAESALTRLVQAVLVQALT